MEHGSINYIEFAANNFAETKQFFTSVFDWSFEDYGEEYTAFTAKGLMGGFYAADLKSQYEQGGALLVFYSERLEETLQKVESAGGKIAVPIFAFPGGRRFHFIEPSGNEMAVWGE